MSWQKRGRLEVFTSFEPDKTAFAVIDMQNFFVQNSQPCIAIIPRINLLANALRNAGGPGRVGLPDCGGDRGRPQLMAHLPRVFLYLRRSGRAQERSDAKQRRACPAPRSRYETG